MTVTAIGGIYMNYTELLIEADSNCLITKDKPLKANDGRIKGNRIAIRKDMPTTQKKCVLAEELGHYHTNAGNILNQLNMNNRKQEYKARIWAYNHLIGLNNIISSCKAGCCNLYEMADYLDVTEEFLKEALSYYKHKYSPHVVVGNFIIFFEPNLTVSELTDLPK